MNHCSGSPVSIMEWPVIFQVHRPKLGKNPRSINLAVFGETLYVSPQFGQSLSIGFTVNGGGFNGHSGFDFRHCFHVNQPLGCGVADN